MFGIRTVACMEKQDGVPCNQNEIQRDMSPSDMRWVEADLSLILFSLFAVLEAWVPPILQVEAQHDLFGAGGFRIHLRLWRFGHWLPV